MAEENARVAAEQKAAQAKFNLIFIPLVIALGLFALRSCEKAWNDAGKSYESEYDKCVRTLPYNVEKQMISEGMTLAEVERWYCQKYR